MILIYGTFYSTVLKSNIKVVKYICDSYRMPVAYKDVTDAVLITRGKDDFICLDSDRFSWVYETITTPEIVPVDITYDKYYWDSNTGVFKLNPEFSSSSLTHDMTDKLHVINTSIDAITVDGGILVAKRIAANGGIATVGNVDITGDLNVSTLSTFKDITGTGATLLSTLEVTDTSLFRGTSNFENIVTITNESGTGLSVTGAVVFNNDLSVTGQAFIGDNVFSRNGLALTKSAIVERDSFLDFNNNHTGLEYTARIIHKVGNAQLEFLNSYPLGTFAFNKDVFINDSKVVTEASIVSASSLYALKGIGTSLEYLTFEKIGQRYHVGVKVTGDTWNLATESDFALRADISADAEKLNGLPGSHYTDASNMNAGFLPRARLTGTYDINVDGNASTATEAGVAQNANRLDNQEGSYYTNAANLSSGVLPKERLQGEYDIEIASLKSQVAKYVFIYS